MMIALPNARNPGVVALEAKRAMFTRMRLRPSGARRRARRRGGAGAAAGGAARGSHGVTGLQGNVLVSQADGMAAAVNGQQLAPGARLITTAGAKVTITYERGCLVNMGENQRYTVREAAECTAAKAPPLGAATALRRSGGTAGGERRRERHSRRSRRQPGNRGRRFPRGQGGRRRDSDHRRCAEPGAEGCGEGLRRSWPASSATSGWSGRTSAGKRSRRASTVSRRPRPR